MYGFEWLCASIALVNEEIQILMTFTGLASGSSDDCTKAIAGLGENTSDLFIRFVAADNDRSTWFLSHWENGKQPLGANPTCEEICNFKGVSVYITTPNDDSAALEMVKTSKKFSFVRRKLGSYCKLRFLAGAGYLWHYPKSESGKHYNLLKSDQFDINKVHILSIGKI